MDFRSSSSSWLSGTSVGNGEGARGIGGATGVAGCDLNGEGCDGKAGCGGTGVVFGGNTCCAGMGVGAGIGGAG